MHWKNHRGQWTCSTGWLHFLRRYAHFNSVYFFLFFLLISKFNRLVREHSNSSLQGVSHQSRQPKLSRKGSDHGVQRICQKGSVSVCVLRLTVAVAALFQSEKGTPQENPRKLSPGSLHTPDCPRILFGLPPPMHPPPPQVSPGFFYATETEGFKHLIWAYGNNE